MSKAKRGFGRRTDANQSALVDCLRQLGLRVWVLNDVCDLLVQHGGVTMLAEVRPEGKPQEARKGRQERFQADFQVYWLSTPDDCLALANTLRRWHTLICEGVR